MSDFPGDISALVFRGSVKGNIGEFSLDSQMLKVLMQLDGKKNIATVTKACGLSLVEVKAVLTRLKMLDLIEQIENAIPTLSDDFFDYLSSQYSIALGPIAEVLIDDEIQELGGKQNRIPKHRAAELVNNLARQIPRNEKRVAFQQAMVQRIREG
ncbi:MAG: hypothetical protein JEZ11_05590 [Desulfobacterales bacterium]|nr:hypothetical protein [Desulfobacterales bacterium]